MFHQKHPTTASVQTPELHIKYVFYSAFKTFKSKGWKPKEPGIGIAIDKLERFTGTDTEAIMVRVGNEAQTYTVDPRLLLNTIERKGCYNQNGQHHCGYVTKSDLYRLAKSTKAGEGEIEDTSTAEH